MPGASEGAFPALFLLPLAGSLPVVKASRLGWTRQRPEWKTPCSRARTNGLGRWDSCSCSCVGASWKTSLGSAVCLVVGWWWWCRGGSGRSPDGGLGVSASAFQSKKKTAANLLVFTMLWKQAKRKPARRFKKSPCYQAERQENSFSNVLFQLTLAKFSRDH